MVRTMAHFNDPKLEAQLREIIKSSDRVTYSASEPTDSPPDGTLRVVNINGTVYLYARAGGTWKRVQLV